MKRFWIFIIVAGVVLLGVYTRQYMTRLSKGDLAPQFELKTIEGNSISLAEYRERAVLLHFWATWCGTCMEEFPSLVRFAEDFAGRGVQVLAISEDRSLGDLSNFLKITKPAFPVLIDDGGQTADAYMSYGVPESFLIGPNGVILWRNDGPINWDSLKLRNAVMGMLSDN